MHKIISGLLISYCMLASGYAQSQRRYPMPLMVTVQFHSLTLPFHDLSGNFANMGLGLGTEVGYQAQHTLVQQFQVAWFHNKAAGNGLMAFTQTAWRPVTGSPVYGEVALGAGCLLASRPSTTWQQVNGEWTAKGHAGKAMLVIPLGISAGYDSRRADAMFAPYISYQMMLAVGYNPSVPVVPQTLIQAGSRIYFNR
ncbi:MAG: hypothetical protein SF053_00280 [Bacteroidia bacterium]|nr:hypothetical protein [Bacteroidia bacterium]